MKTCWIIGASHGIGKELAIELYRKGYNLALSSRNESDLNLLKTDLEAIDNNNVDKSSKILIAACDVSCVPSFFKAFEAIREQFNQLDLAIFASGIYEESGFVDFDLTKAKKILDVNLGGFLNFLWLVKSGLKDNYFRHIAAISSVAGYFGMPKSFTYGASKAAMINLCEGIYPELKSRNITLSLINPGFVKTRLTDQNKFKMPFLINANQAAIKIILGLEAKKFEIHFPKKFTFFLKSLRLFPYSLLLPILSSIYQNSQK